MSQFFNHTGTKVVVFGIEIHIENAFVRLLGPNPDGVK
jgi:hypothetical protein